MKKIVSSLVVSFALASTLCAADYYATVDGEKITKADVALVLQDPRINFEQLPDNAKKQVLEQIINKKLIAKKALRDGIESDPTYKDAINKMKQDLAFQVWQKNEIEKIKITDDQKRDFYQKNKDKFVIPVTMEARHILVKTEKEAFDIIKQLDKASNKEDKFATLAKSKSIDPSAKQNGGNLGKFAADQMVPEFSAGCKLLSKNSYSKTPVKTQFGYHVIYLKNKTESKALSYDEVKGNISQIMLANTFNTKAKALTDDLRKSANIVIK